MWVPVRYLSTSGCPAEQPASGSRAPGRCCESCPVTCASIKRPGAAEDLIGMIGCRASTPDRDVVNLGRADRGCQAIWLWPSGRFRRIL